MALKPFKELFDLDISKYLSERDGLSYLNWATCVQLLHDCGAEKVFFTPLKNKDGSSLFFTEKEFVDKNKVSHQCYEVGVHVVIDDLEFDMTGPLMNGSAPVKDNSINQLRIWNAQTRLFVKGVAIHTGLGFKLWVKEENEAPVESKFDDLYAHNILSVKERIEQAISAKLDKGMTLDDIAEKTKVGTGDDIRQLLKTMTKIYNFEGFLNQL